MFIKTLLSRNPQLVQWALYAHRSGLLAPNTYVVDLDSVEQNASNLYREAKDKGVALYMMTKQFARNPLICSAIAGCGIRKAAAVSMDGARMLARQGIALGNLGHLVQIPESQVDEALSMSPEVMTVMDYGNAVKISFHARAMGKRQDILLRVCGEKDMLYPQQGGGIALAELEGEIERIRRLDGVNIVGFTEFPCFATDPESGKVARTENYNSLLRAVEIGRGLGLTVSQVNAPGGNTCAVIGDAAADGVTHMEPGHAFTGTSYQNTETDACVEKPSMLYLTEVSHNWQGRSSVFGGGFYGRSKLEQAVIERDGGLCPVKALPVSPGNIDYYGELERSLPVGTGVVYSFRTQMFMTHSNIAVLGGLSSSAPKLLGVYNEKGQTIS